MDLLDIILRVIGAFYAFAGVVATRAALTSHLLDVAIAAIGAKVVPRVELLRTAWLLTAATLVLAGGVALMLLLDWAPALFVTSALGQLAYLAIAAPSYFDRGDPPDAKGRRQTTNAFILYTAATAFVCWAYAAGRLHPLLEINPVALAAGALAVAANLIYIARLTVLPRRTGAGTEE